MFGFLTATLRNVALLLTPAGAFLGAFQLRERAFTQMHTRREDVYRNFEKPFNKWIIRNAWLLHMNYPRHVKHLLMAHEMHKLHFKEKKLVRDLISAQEGGSRAEVARIRADIEELKGDLLLLDVIRREARRYVKSSALFQDPTPLDLEMINSAAVNLHDLEVGVHFPPG